MIDSITTLVALVILALVLVPAAAAVLRAVKQWRARKVTPEQRAELNYMTRVKAIHSGWMDDRFELDELEDKLWRVTCQRDTELAAGESDAGMLVAALNERAGRIDTVRTWG